MKYSLVRLSDLCAGDLVMCTLKLPDHMSVCVSKHIKTALLSLPNEMKKHEDHLQMICQSLIDDKRNPTRYNVFDIINKITAPSIVAVSPNYLGRITFDVILSVSYDIRKWIVSSVSGKSEDFVINSYVITTTTC